MRKMVIILVTFFLVMFTASCSSQVSSALDNRSCEEPCWRDVVIGETTLDQAGYLVKSMPDVSIETIREAQTFRADFEKIITWKFKERRELYGEIYFIDNIVQMITFSYQSPMNIKDLLDVFGEPDYVYSDKAVLDGINVKSVLLYENKGICLVHEKSLFAFEKVEDINLRPNTQISSMYYVDPSVKNAQTRYGCFWGLDEQEFNKYKQPWQGYQKYPVHLLGSDN